MEIFERLSKEKAIIFGILSLVVYYWKIILFFILYAIHYILIKINLWTFFILFLISLCYSIIILFKVRRNREEIKKLSFINYISMSECQEICKKKTAIELSKLWKNPRVIALKHELEQKAKKKDLLSLSSSDSNNSDLSNSSLLSDNSDF